MELIAIDGYGTNGSNAITSCTIWLSGGNFLDTDYIPINAQIIESSDGIEDLQISSIDYSAAMWTEWGFDGCTVYLTKPWPRGNGFASIIMCLGQTYYNEFALVYPSDREWPSNLSTGFINALDSLLGYTLNGKLVKNVAPYTGSNYTLTHLEYACPIWEFTGTIAGNVIIYIDRRETPLSNMHTVYNNTAGGSNIILKIKNGYYPADQIIITPGKRALVETCNQGTKIYRITADC